ncbi:hypothetical protein [Shinella sp. DD12]|uniref:hypothetical protein n=1 Tax=Shinella sp. DD12 TaxID=1410620 RepID=UPI0003C54435|nr:hypothetical protein [Shinella sp. DD12]EYR81853.1 hypothetical protein SHLA_4c001450 [Shinella sp. DD12]
MNAMERILAAMAEGRRNDPPHEELSLLDALRCMLPAAEADAAESQGQLDFLRAEIAKLEAAKEESEMT